MSQITPFSKTRLSYRVPPPTTILGALSYPLSLQIGGAEVDGDVSWANRLRPIILWCAVRLKQPISRILDTARIYWYHKARKQAKTDAFAVEKVYVSGDEAGLDIAVLINKDKAESMFGSLWDRLIISSAWSVVRIGQKESLFSIEDVELFYIEKILYEEHVKTSFYFPRYLANKVEGTMIIEFFVKPDNAIGDYSNAERVPYIVPYDEDKGAATRVNAYLTERAGVIALPDGDKLIVDKEVIET